MNSLFTVSIGNQKCRVYKFQFSMDSIKRRELIKKAELRLYVRPSKSKMDIAAKVSIVQNSEQEGYDFDDSRFRRFSASLSPSLIVYGGSSQWVTFSVTSIVQRHLRNNQKLINLHACVENIYQNEMLNNFYIDSLDEEYSPVLVIYSNERKRRKRALKSKHNLIAKEVILHQFRSSKDRIESAQTIDSNLGRQDKTIAAKPRNSPSGTTSKRKLRQRRRKFRPETRTKIKKSATTEFLTYLQPTVASSNFSVSKRTNETSSTVLKDVDMLLGDDPLAVLDSSGRVTRTLEGKKDRKKGKKRPRKRTPCSRSPMYVDFEEIGWDSWIIAPKGYNVSNLYTMLSVPKLN